MPHPEIDLVFTYVDGADPAHTARLAQMRQALGQGSGEAGFPAIRPTWYRNVSELTYGVRSALRFLPWLRTIFIVTDRQAPPVDPDLIASGKVRVVDHADIIPERYRPVFDATIIESFLHRIEGLSEIFLYNNDDMLFGQPLEPGDFVAEADGGAVRLRLMTQPGLLRVGIATAAALAPPFLPRANTFTAGIANSSRLLHDRLGLAWRETLYPRHFTHTYRIATARRIEELIPNDLDQARSRHLRSHDQLSWIALAYSLETKWQGAERRASPSAERLFLDFERYAAPRRLDAAWHRLATSRASFLCLNNIPADQAGRFEQVMRQRGLGEPLPPGS